MNNLYTLAQAYGAGTYNDGVYNCTENCTTTTPPNNDGGLIDTGNPIFIPIALGAALIIAAIILLITKAVRRRKMSAK